MAAAFQLFDGLQVAATGALRGLGETRVPMFISLLGYWVSGLPLGWWLCFRAGYGVIGLWLGLAASLFFVGSALLYLWHRPDRPGHPPAGRSNGALVTLTPDRLDAALAGLPRVALGQWPTPVVPLRRLGAALGLDLWLKRDDCSGLALGGNKARKLEFVLGDAMARGAKTLVTAGPLTSNHTMMTSAAARRLGLDVHVILGGDAPGIQQATSR